MPQDPNTVTVDLPNGTSIDFPASMSATDIDAAIRGAGVGGPSTPATRFRDFQAAEQRNLSQPHRPDEIGPTTAGKVPIEQPLDLGGLVKPAGDNRSGVARAIDAVNAPILPQISRGGHALEERLSTPFMAEQRINDVVPGLGTAIAASRGFGAGVAGGVADLIGGLSSPLGLVTTMAGMGGERAAAAGLPAVAQLLRGAEAAGGAAYAARGLEQTAKAGNAQEAGQGLVMAAGGALGVRGGVGGFREAGAPRVDVAPARVPVGELPPAPRFIVLPDGTVAPFGATIPEEAPRVPTAADSYVRGVPGEYARPEVGFRRELPPAVVPRFEAGESGPAAPYGSTPQAPYVDPSFVRGVPAEYARREVRGELPPANPPTFIVDESGRVVPAARASELDLSGLVRPARGVQDVAPVPADTSGLRVVPAAPAAYGFENARGPKGGASQRMVTTQYSSDPNATPAPQVELTPEVQHALNWIREDYASHGFTPRTFVEAGPGRGGDLEVTAGAGGSEMHSYITGGRNVGRASVVKAIDNLEAGKLTPLGADVLSAAQDLAAGKREAVRSMTLPPEAGGDLTGTIWESRRPPIQVDEQPSTPSEPVGPRDTNLLDEQGLLDPNKAAARDARQAANFEELRRLAAQDRETYAAGAARPITGQRLKLETEVQGAHELDRLLTDMHGEDRPTVGNGTYDYDQFSNAVDQAAAQRPAPGNGREPGEEGKINPILAARLGGGAVGAAIGAATGDDTADKIKRAALYGAAGALLPSLLEGGAATAASAAASAQKVAEAERIFTGQRGARGPQNEQAPLDLPIGQLMRFPAEHRSQLLKLVADNGGFQEARGGGRQTWANIDAAALRTAVNLSNPGRTTAPLPQEIGAFKNALATLQEKAEALGKKVKSGAATDVEKLEFLKANADRVAAASGLFGRVTSAGRALNYSKQLAQVMESADIRFVREALKQSGGDAAKVADALAQLQGDPIGQLKYLQSQQALGPLGLARGIFYQNILSGVKTTLRNVVGNTVNALTDTLIKPTVTVPLDIAESKIFGRQRQVFLAETPAEVMGALLAIPQASRNALFSLRHGFPLEDAMAGSFDHLQPELPGGLAANFFTRFLEAQDKFQYTMLREAQEWARAVADVKKGGFSTRGNVFEQRVADAKLNLSDAEKSAAAGEAARMLFREDPGAFVNWIANGKRQFPLLDFVIPFIKINSNQIRQALERSPVGLAMPALKQAGREGVEARGRMLGGTAALAGLAYYVGVGNITGTGPSDPGERNLLYARGWRPNSIKLNLPDAVATSLGASKSADGSYYVSYNGLPAAPVLAALSNGYQSWNEAGRKAGEAGNIAIQTVFKTANSILQQSFWASALGLVEAFQDPERHAVEFVKQFATSAVPLSGLSRNVAQAIDPTIRKPATITESVKAIIPGLSQQVPPRREVFGDEATRPGNAFQRGLAVPPLQLSPTVDSPVVKRLQDLGVTLAVPQGTLKFRGRDIPDTADERDAVVQAVGAERKRLLEQVFSSPTFDEKSPEAQARMARAALEAATTMIHNRVRGQSGKQPITVASLVTPRREGTQ